jgi:hypothetical protein
MAYNNRVKIAQNALSLALAAQRSALSVSITVGPFIGTS